LSWTTYEEPLLNPDFKAEAAPICEAVAALDAATVFDAPDDIPDRE